MISNKQILIHVLKKFFNLNLLYMHWKVCLHATVLEYIKLAELFTSNQTTTLYANCCKLVSLDIHLEECACIYQVQVLDMLCPK